MPTAAKIRHLRVRPLKSADLAFNMPGILAWRSPTASLGTRVPLQTSGGTPFNIQDVYAALGQADPSGRLLSGAQIRALVQNVALFTLRNESLRVCVDQAVSQRQNAFFERYAHNSDRLNIIRKLYPTSTSDPTGETSAGSKTWRLLQLDQYLQQRHDALDAAYGQTAPDGISRAGVVNTRRVDLSNSVSYTKGNTVTSQAKLKPLQTYSMAHNTAVSGNGVSQSIASDPFTSYPRGLDGSPLTDPFVSQTTSTVYPAGEGSTTAQKTLAYPTEYAHPSINNHIRTLQGRLDVDDQYTSNAIYALRVLNLLDIWANELAVLDAEVAKLQINFLHSFLIPFFPAS